LEHRGRQREESMRRVAAKNVEAERSVPFRVDDHVDRIAELDAVRAHGKAEQVAGGEPGHLVSRFPLRPAGNRPPPPEPPNPPPPRGTSKPPLTSSTREPAGPRRHHVTSASTASGSPSKTASTVPSALFRTQPARLRERARCKAE